MEIVEATGRILEAGKSPELTALLAGVSEATAADGEPRFAPSVYRDMARAIVCRTYAKPMLELCHLVNAADACGRGGDRWESFFYAVDAARPSAFRGYLETVLESDGWRRKGVEATAEGLSLQYDDAVFNVRYGRMPFLAALLEAVLMMIDYRRLDGVFRDMLAQPGSEAAISDAANALNRLVYAYLKDHLPSTQSADKFEAIIDFLKSAAGGASGGFEIDDQTVLTFWQRQSGGADESIGDYRTFRGVAGAFVDFLRSLETADDRYDVTHAKSIGNDREAGEIDPGLLPEEDGLGANTAEAWESPLNILDAPPADAVKFLNKKEREDLEGLMAYGPLARDLPATVLRSEIFGHAQSRITQALRSRTGGKALAEMLACVEVENYAERQVRYRQSAGHIERVQKATLHALTANSSGAADDQEEDGESNVVPLFAAQAEAADRALEAFKSFNRKGFDEAELAQEHIREAFGVGAGVLIRVAEQLDSYLITLEKMNGQPESGQPGLEAHFEGDRSIFAAEFARLYGERT